MKMSLLLITNPLPAFILKEDLPFPEVGTCCSAPMTHLSVSPWGTRRPCLPAPETLRVHDVKARLTGAGTLTSSAWRRHRLCLLIVSVLKSFSSYTVFYFRDGLYTVSESYCGRSLPAEESKWNLKRRRKVFVRPIWFLAPGSSPPSWRPSQTSYFCCRERRWRSKEQGGISEEPRARTRQTILLWSLLVYFTLIYFT